MIKEGEKDSLAFVSSKNVAFPTPGIARSNPGMVRTVGQHYYGENAYIMFANVNGMDNINGRVFQVQHPMLTYFELGGKSANTAGGDYTSGLDGNGGLVRSFYVDETSFSGSSEVGAYQHKLRVENDLINNLYLERNI